MRFQNLSQLNRYVSELNSRQVTTVSIDSIEQIHSSLVFYGCYSPDDDSYEYYIFNSRNDLAFYSNFHETELRQELPQIKEYVQQNIRDINKIVIIHDHDCASDCDFNEYIKVINII